jgi:hypothetical protein
MLYSLQVSSPRMAIWERPTEKEMDKKEMERKTLVKSHCEFSQPPQ